MEPLTDFETQVYRWQMWIDGIGDLGQRKLKAASVLISRVGGLGGTVALQLAAAGVGRLVLAHSGDIKPSDLHRQILMTETALGTSRVACAAAELRERNPRCEIVEVTENITPANALGLVRTVDIAVGAAPMFEERLALNAACVELDRPMVDASMYGMSGALTTIVPRETACLACRVPEPPETWTREFPVLGAVSATVGCLAAVEVVKWICGFGELLTDRLLTFDLRDVRFTTITVKRRSDCEVCGSKG